MPNLWHISWLFKEEHPEVALHFEKSSKIGKKIKISLVQLALYPLLYGPPKPETQVLDTRSVTNWCAQNRAALPLPIWSKLYVVLANLQAKITKTASKLDDRIYPLSSSSSKVCTVFQKYKNSACFTKSFFFVLMVKIQTLILCTLAVLRKCRHFIIRIPRIICEINS